MNKYFHGTNAENAIDILANGFNTRNRNWNLSEENMVYFWDITVDRNEENCIEDAFHSACKSSALKNSKSNYTVVFEMEFDSGIMNDESCDIAPWETRVCIRCSDINELMKNNKVIIKVHKFTYMPQERAKYLYSTYHSCGGVRWDSVKDQVVDIDDLIKDITILEKVTEYEHYFLEIYKNKEIG